MNIYKVVCTNNSKVVSSFYTEYIWLALVDFALKNRIFTLKRSGNVVIRVTQTNAGDIDGGYCNMISQISCSKTGEVLNVIELKTLHTKTVIETGFSESTEKQYKGKSYARALDFIFSRFAAMSGENIAVAKILAVIAIKDKHSPLWKENKYAKQKLELG